MEFNNHIGVTDHTDSPPPYSALDTDSYVSCLHSIGNNDTDPWSEDSLEPTQLLVHPGTERPVVHREPEIKKDVVDQGWELTRYYRFHYWTRMVKNGNEIWHQYGISERGASDRVPEFFFTCKMKSRGKGHEHQIKRFCEAVARHMRYHRSDDYHGCACNFENWRNRRGCPVRWYHRAFLSEKYCIGVFMDYHDRHCSCGCFDVETSEHSITTSS